MTIETKRIISNFPSVFVDCNICFETLFANYTTASHAVRLMAEAAANHHNDKFNNLHAVMMVISESPKAE